VDASERRCLADLIRSMSWREPLCSTLSRPWNSSAAPRFWSALRPFIYTRATSTLPFPSTPLMRVGSRPSRGRPGDHQNTRRPARHCGA
jgi:hypothetical protein